MDRVRMEQVPCGSSPLHKASGVSQMILSSHALITFFFSLFILFNADRSIFNDERKYIFNFRSGDITKDFLIIE